ncbi:unnamed protein product, partial [Thlaspi arvense]
MEFSSFLLSLILFLLNLSLLVLSNRTNHDDFLSCLSRKINENTFETKITHTSKDSSFSSILASSIQNPRFSVPETPKPVSIITPVQATDVQTTLRTGPVESKAEMENCTMRLVKLPNLLLSRPVLTQPSASEDILAVEVTSDNVIDALLVDARGRILDRQAMGEEYFWATRGGGGSSFAVVLSWKIRLVDVSSMATVLKVEKTSESEAVPMINKWQYVADNVPNNLYIRATLERSNNNAVQTSFSGNYIGPVNDLLALMEDKFPLLGLRVQDCTEMSWIESVLWFANSPNGETLAALANQYLSRAAVQELWRRVEAPKARLAKILLTPFGVKMSEIAEHETPFPHREGNLYQIQYMAYWRQEEDKDKRETKKYLKWVENVYHFMTPYVLKSPRGAYVNFMDHNSGMYTRKEKTKYEEGKSWGVKYFKNNFERLVRVKSSVDPTYFFCQEQSIPPLKSAGHF